MAAMVAASFNLILKTFYAHAIAAVKPKKAALIAVANKNLDLPQRHPQRSKAMANRLTAKTGLGIDMHAAGKACANGVS